MSKEDLMKQLSDGNFDRKPGTSAGPPAPRCEVAGSRTSAQSSDTEQQLDGPWQRHASSCDGDSAASDDGDSSHVPSPEGPKAHSAAANDHTSRSSHSSERSAGTAPDGTDALSLEGPQHADSPDDTAGSDSGASSRSDAPDHLREDADSNLTIVKPAQLGVGVDAHQTDSAAPDGGYDAAAELGTAQHAEDDGSSAELPPRQLFIDDERADALFHRSPGVRTIRMIGAEACMSPLAYCRSA